MRTFIQEMLRRGIRICWSWKFGGTKKKKTIKKRRNNMGFLLLLLLSVPCFSQDATGGFQALLADKLKEAKPVGILNLNSRPAVAAFLPIWTFHDISGTDFFEVGAGGKFQDGKKAHGFLGFDFNLVGISQRMWSGEWARNHVKRTSFPPIFLGPSIEIPVDMRLVKDWRIEDNAGVFFSVRFGTK